MSVERNEVSNFLSVKEAAEILKWKVPKVLRAIKSNQLQAEKVGGWNWILPRTEVEALARRETKLLKKTQASRKSKNMGSSR